MVRYRWVSATRAKWWWEHDKCHKWHCRKMRAGASFTTGDSSLLKEKDKHSVYLCCVCVFLCERNPLVQLWELVFVTLTVLLWHKWKRFFSFSYVKHFYLSLAGCQHFYPYFPHTLWFSICVPQHFSLCLARSPVFCLLLSSLAAPLLLSFHHLLSELGIWAVENREGRFWRVQNANRWERVRNGNRVPG